MHRLTPSLLSLLLLAGCGGAPDQPEVDDAWVRLPAVVGRPAAAYFTLEGGDAPDRLIGIDSTGAKRIELHSGGSHNGMMQMRAIRGVDLPASSEQAFAPGGNHAMLFDLNPAVAPGGTLPLRFRFASGHQVDVTARLVAAGDPAPVLD